jgi:hypothetical protein
MSKQKGVPFNVWLANPQKLKFNWNALCEEVANHFLYVVKETDEFNGVVVRSTMTRPVLHAHDLMVYIIGAKHSSVVAAKFGPGGGTGGYTAFEMSGKRLTASEAYMHAQGDELRLNPRQLAIMVFHEAMHNVLQEGEKMHSRGGMAAEKLNYDTAKHNKKDDKAMAAALSKLAPQWLDGWDHAKPFEKINLNQGDPLDGL